MIKQTKPCKFSHWAVLCMIMLASYVHIFKISYIVKPWFFFSTHLHVQLELHSNCCFRIPQYFPQTVISWSMGLSSVSGHLPVIRSLPTVASSIRAGVTAYCKGKFCNESDLKPFLYLFSLIGHVEEVSESYLDAITSVSGSGLAFVSSKFYTLFTLTWHVE